jgi:methyl-accepting chemotaxis protein
MIRKVKKIKKTKAKIFQDEMFSYGAKNNIITATIIFVYILLFLEISFNDFGFILLFATTSVLIFQFFVAPFTNASYTRQISNQLILWKEGSLDIDKSTALFVELLRCPRIIMYYVFILFGSASLLFILLMYFFIGISLVKLIFLFTVCVFASYVAGVIALFTSEIVCHKYAIPIFDSGIDLSELESKKYYGISLKIQFLLFTIIPALFVSVLTFAYFLIQKDILLEQNIFSLGRTVLFFLTNTVILISLFLAFRNNSILEIAKVQYLLEWLSKTDFKSEKEVPVALSNEISYISFLIRNTIHRFPKILDFYKRISSEISELTFFLKKYKSEEETVSETNYRVIGNINEEVKKINQSSDLFFAELDSFFDTHDQIKSIIDEAYALISQSKDTALQNTNKNLSSTREIKNLENQLTGISEITSLLTDIADQIKIIAFNAELEAVKAGASGKNFLIIATEIRRLADYTMDSIIETQEQISLVHTTTEKLISHFQDSLEITKKSKTFLEKNEMLLDEMKEKAEINVIDIPDVQRYKIKEGQIHNAILSLTEQLKHLLDEASLHAYDMSENIECFERLADRVAKGEV